MDEAGQNWTNYIHLISPILFLIWIIYNFRKDKKTNTTLEEKTINDIKSRLDTLEILYLLPEKPKAQRNPSGGIVIISDHE